MDNRREARFMLPLRYRCSSSHKMQAQAIRWRRHFRAPVIKGEKIVHRFIQGHLAGERAHALLLLTAVRIPLV